MIIKTTWNTGRLYTKEGQVITAQTDGKRVIFSDHSRMIAGVIRGMPIGSFDVATLRAFVDRKYLHNEYDYDSDAYALKREALT